LRVDSRGQSIVIFVSSPADCVLIVSTNYVHTFRAQATYVDTADEVRVFPIDIALTGVVVPRGASAVTIEPIVSIPSWARIAQLAGLAALAVALWALVRYRRS
jgi:hypothetical protein